MSPTAKRFLVIPAAAAVSLVLAGCQKHAETAGPAWTLDESQLIQPIRFHPDDVDPAISACTDFGAHTNDKWLAANPIPDDQSRWGAFMVLRDRSLQVQKQLAEQIAAEANPQGIHKTIADLWTTGMDEAALDAQGITPLAARLAEVDALADGAAVAAWLRAQAAVGNLLLFDFGPEADFNDSSMNMAYAVQGGTSLPDKTYYFAKDKQSVRDAFAVHVQKMLELSGVSAEDAEAQARDVMAFETRLAGASKSEEDLSRDVSLYYHPVTAAEADELAPNFPWTAFFESQQLAVPAKFSLAMPDFHREVSRMLDDVPLAQWKSYLRFRLVDDAAPYLGKAFADQRFEFYNKTLLGQPAQQPRWKRVLNAIEQSAGEAMGEVYVEAAFPPESRAQMEQLVGNLVQALKGRIENLTWMSGTTKEKALAKWAAFTTKIGYPEKWRDWSGLATSRDSYYGNVMAARAFNYRHDLDKIGKPVDRTEWVMSPQTVNAYYNPLQNEIVFPAAILQPPFFDPSMDAAYNYGAIGAVIGHEITHGFDDQGSRFGPTGNFEQWWTPADARQFKALTGKLVKQFDGYRVGPENLPVNGNLTLGENIADLGGLAIAYDALHAATKDQPDAAEGGLTRDQRFFYGWGSVWRGQMRPEALKVRLATDPHSPEWARVVGALANHPAFAAAFGCKDTDPMVNAGDKRVVIW